MGRVVNELRAVPPTDTFSLPERVAQTLRAAIVAGRLPPGCEFSSRQFANDMGVSFIPVREALRSLEAEGLLLIRPGRSATVAPLTDLELGGLFALRRQLEPERAASVVLRSEPGYFDHLEQVLSSCADPTANRNDHGAEHFDFHNRLLRLDDSPTVDGRTVTMLIQASSRYLRLAVCAAGSPLDYHRVWGNPHLDLLDAFRSGDPQVARTAMVDYLLQAERFARTATVNHGAPVE